MAGIPKVIDTSAVLGVKIFCEDIPAANLVDRPITVEAEFVPGARSAQHVHPHQEESYRVLSGVLDVLVDGRWKRLQPGPEKRDLPELAFHGISPGVRGGPPARLVPASTRKGGHGARFQAGLSVNKRALRFTIR